MASILACEYCISKSAFKKRDKFHSPEAMIKSLVITFWVLLFAIAPAVAKTKANLFAASYEGGGSLKNTKGEVIVYDAGRITISDSGKITGTVNTPSGMLSLNGKVTRAAIKTNNAAKQVVIGKANLRFSSGVKWQGKMTRVDDKKLKTTQITAKGKMSKAGLKGKFSFASAGAVGPFANGQNGLKGSIYYIFARELFRLDLARGNRTKIAGRLPGYFEDFYLDVSRQNDEMLLIDSSGINYQYINLVSPTNTGLSLARFRVLENEIRGAGISKISPDKSKIMLVWEMGEFPSARRGVFFYDRAGKLLSSFENDDEGNPVLEADWLPDGNAMLMTNKGFFRTNDPALLRASFIVKPSAGGFGYMSISPDGTRMAYRAIGEIWTMNIDGTNQRQLTNSVPNVYYPTWSPDGKHICFLATKFISFAGPGPIVGGGGDLLQLVVAPADDKLYDLNKEAFETITGSGVINGDNLVAKNGLILITYKDGAVSSSAFSTRNIVWR